jgi:hypothetical protein
MIIKYNELSKFIKVQNPDIIIWPETAVPYKKNIEAKKYDTIKYFDEVPLLTGIKLTDHKQSPPVIYSSAVFISGSKELIDYYHKVNLLPFAEKSYLPFLTHNLLGLKQFSKGTGNKLFEYKNIKFINSICYEDIIPSFIRTSLNRLSLFLFLFVYLLQPLHYHSKKPSDGGQLFHVIRYAPMVGELPIFYGENSINSILALQPSIVCMDNFSLFEKDLGITTRALKFNTSGLLRRVYQRQEIGCGNLVQVSGHA